MTAPNASIALFADARANHLAEAKAGRSLSVAIPARNEEATVGRIVSAIREALMERTSLVDEIVVLDHDSTDATAEVSAAAGAVVVPTNSVAAEFGPALGKGDVLWRSVIATRGDIIAWLDADLELFTAESVVSLVAPLIFDRSVAMVRADYIRMLEGKPAEGGRVTELAARPLLKLLHPHLAHIRQPLGGEYAVRRDVAQSMPFEVDYGVEIGLLIDVAAAYGPHAIAQADLGHRVHRNRPLHELHDQAGQVMRAMLVRAGASLPETPTVRPPIGSLTGALIPA